MHFVSAMISWFVTVAAIVAAVASVAARNTVPWQGLQAALVMAGGMVAVAATNHEPMINLAVGAVLLVSAMIGTMGVRGTRAAASCCHRAISSLVMAICAFESATPAASTVSTGHEHGLSGYLSILMTIGGLAVVMWTLATECRVEPSRSGRAARLHSVESWAMASGVAMMCFGS